MIGTRCGACFVNWKKDGDGAGRRAPLRPHARPRALIAIAAVSVYAVPEGKYYQRGFAWPNITGHRADSRCGGGSGAAVVAPLAGGTGKAAVPCDAGAVQPCR